MKARRVRLPSIALRKKRLRTLASFLMKVPPGRFNYTVWTGSNWQGKEDLSCGTTACALGWAATMPEFRRLGLRLTRMPGAVRGMGYVALSGWTGDLSRDSPARAAEKVFGLSFVEFSYLFTQNDELGGKYSRNPGVHATPAQVAAHIRQFVNKRYPR